MKPITFRTDMVKAILDGRKSQTRMIIKPQPEHDEDSGYVYWKKRQFDIHEYFWSDQFPRYCPYGETGDILYVKETWTINPWSYLGGCKYLYKTDYDNIPKCDLGKSYPDVAKWKSSRFMPKAAARIFLEITDIRVERLVEINEEDAIAEGVTNADNYIGLADDSKINRYAYCELWDSINGEGAFELNPWVWVISFKRVEV